MKFVGKLLGVIVAAFVLLMVVQWIASESGEVVVLSTASPDGSTHQTRLWVVEHDGSSWLRSGSPQAGWFARLQCHPEVSVERNGAGFTATAAPDATERTAVNKLMREKYGWADQFIALMFGRDDAIPVRLIVED